MATTKKISKVRGLIFGGADYPNLEAWRDAGHPSNCSVTDVPYFLIASNIPICDAVLIRGAYIRGTPRVTLGRVRRVKVSKIAVNARDVEVVDWPSLIPLKVPAQTQK